MKPVGILGLIHLSILFLASCESAPQTPPEYAQLFDLETRRVLQPDAYRAYLTHTNPDIRHRALDVISKHQDSVFVPILTQLANDSGSGLFAPAIDALGLTFHPDAEAPLRKLYAEQPNHAHRILPALAKTGQKNHIADYRQWFTRSPYSEIGYDVAIMIRRDPAFTDILDQAIQRWDSYPDSIRSGYLTAFRASPVEYLKHKRNWLINQYESLNGNRNFHLTGRTDVLRCLIKIEFTRSQRFLKKHLKYTKPWPELIALLELLRLNPRADHHEAIYNLMSLVNIHPQIQQYVVNNAHRFRLKRDFYTFLFLQEGVDKYIALSHKYREETLRFINNRFESLNPVEQTTLIRALFNTRDKSAVTQFGRFYPQLSIASKTALLTGLNQHQLDIPSIWAAALADTADEARSYLIAEAAERWQKTAWVPQLIRHFSELDASKQEALQKLKSVIQALKPDVNQSSITVPPDSGLIATQFESVRSNQYRFLEIILKSGRIRIQLRPDIAPRTTHYIAQLANRGFYDDIYVHRVVPDFVTQAGDPRGDGWGGSGYVLRSEHTATRFKRGMVGIATSGKDTGSSQFFIMHRYAPHLDGKYTVFGEVVSGMDVVERLRLNQRIYSIRAFN